LDHMLQKRGFAASQKSAEQIYINHANLSFSPFERKSPLPRAPPVIL
jgi:hypothetical protein